MPLYPLLLLHSIPTITGEEPKFPHLSFLTDRFASDEGTLEELTDQILVNTDHISLDGAYDSYEVYAHLSDKFNNASIVIPPDKNAVINDNNHAIRNENLKLIKEHGRITCTSLINSCLFFIH